MDPIRNPRLTVDAGRNDQWKAGRIRYRLQDVGAAAHTDGAALDERCHSCGLGSSDLRSYQSNDVSGFGLGISRLIPGAQVHKDMLMGQDQAKLIRAFGAKSCNQLNHGGVGVHNLSVRRYDSSSSEAGLFLLFQSTGLSLSQGLVIKIARGLMGTAINFIKGGLLDQAA